MFSIYSALRRKFTGILVNAALKLLCLLLPAKRTRTALEGRKKLLVVRLDRVGDFILWLDAARELRALYPPERYEITLLGSKAWVALGQGCGLFDRVWTFDRRLFNQSRVYQLGVVSLVRKGCFDVAIQPTYSREYAGDKIIQLSGAVERIGSAGDFSNMTPGQKLIQDKWYTRVLPAADEPLMELVRNAEFMRELGCRDFKARVPEFPGGALQPLDMVTGDYYILSLGANWPGRRWPVENFRELAKRVYGATGWAGVVCGSMDEKKLGDALAEGLDMPVINLSGRTSLGQLAYVVSRSRFVVTNETGTIHIAAAVSTPSVCILGGGHYGRFMPYPAGIGNGGPLPLPVNMDMDCFGCNWKCKYAVPDGEPVPCIAGITVDMAWDAVEPLLRGRRDGQHR